jgi:hypothetical protein
VTSSNRFDPGVRLGGLLGERNGSCERSEGPDHWPAKTDALFSGWVEVYEQDPLLAKDFASASSISGVDLGRLPAAFWHTEIYLAESGVVAPRGEVVVEGVDLDGKVTGIEQAITGPITSFKWP